MPPRAQTASSSQPPRSAAKDGSKEFDKIFGVAFEGHMSRKSALIVILSSLLILGASQPTPVTYENLNAVLWMQTSVEYKASAIQVYRLAESALLRGLKDPKWTGALEQNDNFENLPPAVILDLDETVLDNSVLQARLTTSGERYSDAVWRNWVELGSAGLVPGAMDFLQFAHANGVAPLYITNRVCDSSKVDDPTVRLLRNLQVPLDPVGDRLFCDDGKHGDKTERRKRCAAKFRILLLFGDQLGDFLQIDPDSNNLESRQKLFEAHQGLWGERWFQLSNPTYGSWEDSLGYSVPDKLKHLRR
jgi:5'-nucleotidase (lipoprotein e(P4) family)